MPRANPIQPSFNAGEFSPRMVARTDFAKYPLACATLENMIPIAQGGAMRRPGTRFVAAVKDSTRPVKLRSFEFSTVQAYILECGEGYFRFYKDGGQIAVATSDAAITNGNFTSNITGWTDKSSGAAAISHDAANGRLNLDGVATEVAATEQAVALTSIGQEHAICFRVFGAPGDSVLLRIGTSSGATNIVNDVVCKTGWHCRAFTPSASPIYIQFRNAAAKTLQLDDVSINAGGAVEIVTPYLDANLFEIKQAQSADVLYLCHPDHPILKLLRHGHTSWSLTELAFQDGPWLLRNSGATEMTPSATTGLGVTITADGTAGINDGAGFLATDVGRLIRLSNPATGTDWSWAVITGRSSATVVTVDVKRDFSTTNATADWQLGAWCGSCGYPSAITFFEQRLCFAGTRGSPQTFWMSQSADFENMAPDSADASSRKWDGAIENDDALDFTVSADQVNAIRWMAPASQLFIGTVGGEWVVSSNGPVITPVDISVRRQTTFGTTNLPPQLMRGRLMFIQRAGRKLLEFAFNLEQDNFNALDLNVLSDHINAGGIVDLAYQQEPESTLLAVRSDGQVPTLTYQPDQNVVGWARCLMGGTDAACESVSVIPGVATDEAWVCVARTVNGQTVRQIERFAAPFEHGGDQALACYSDAALLYQGSPTTTVAGLDHLEGELVSILADGAVHSPRVVSGGGVTLDYPASKVIAGLPYTHTYESLKWEVGARTGTAQGQIKRISGVTLVLLDALNAAVGPDREHLSDIPFRSVEDAMDSAVPLFTGEKFVEFNGDFSTDARVVIRGADPVPFTLLAVSPELKTNTR